MKRDMDLIRNILLTVSESDNEVVASVFVDENNDMDKVLYNIEIMKEAVPNYFDEKSIYRITGFNGSDNVNR
ncbi:MAG: hypothetical protein SPI59_05300 [Finegoldia sp.]|nr:hypothetical protein [Finegoldia sp.]